MEIIKTPGAMTSWSRTRSAAGKTIALVPTMGFFHEGHLCLMRRASELADAVVVSLFVNPIQFSPGEDLGRYPRNFDRDAALAEGCGVDALFAPAISDMYPGDSATRVSVSGLTENLCGLTRPGHFTGVATVVAKLFNIVLPRYAVFGKKDYQQLAVIKRMVRDLNWDIKIIGHSIVREPDGLAMSSRNVYLSSDERQAALCLNQALSLAKSLAREGETRAGKIMNEIRGLINIYDNVALEYATVVSGETLVPQETIDAGSVVALAAKVGGTRLIDNIELFEGE